MKLGLPSGTTMEQAQDIIKTSLSGALGIDKSDIWSLTVTEVVRRRMDASFQRRLQSKEYEISYQIIVSDEKDLAALTAKVSEIGTGGDMQAEFIKQMQGQSVSVSDIVTTVAPVAVKATVVTDKDGNRIEPSPAPTPSTAPAPAPKAVPSPAPDGDTEEGGGSMGAIIGGVVGGIFGLCICTFLVYWFVLRKKSQQE
jgi:hypothetical protein